MLKSLVNRIAGDPMQRTVRAYQRLVDEVNALEPKMQALSDEQMRARTAELMARHADGRSLDDLMPEAFALVREASRRTIGLRHFDVQIIGGAVLHRGEVAEMKTGEGKTLVATLAMYLNALTGKGVHLVTPNDYLSKVGVQWMGPVYHALGLTSGVIQNIGNSPETASFLFDPDYQAQDDRYQRLRPVPRREVYAADITYGTNNEFGFDYLRDNMVWDLRERVQRPLYFAIVDEVDNILIDEARTPLIISGPAEEATDEYVRFAQLVRRLHRDDDYSVEEKTRSVTPTDAGIEKIETALGGINLYDPEHYHLTPYFENALKAQVLFERDKEYIVKDGEVIIVDEFTGRLMPGRRFSEGLHQAIEAKEGVHVQRESVTLATITFQNYFRMYEKLAGMTGTALTEAEELHKIYSLDVTAIPTHRPVVRTDHADLVYKTPEAKWRAVVEQIAELHRAGQPVLVGTVSVESSERLSRRLEQRGVPHEVLNAKNHEREAEIIAQAGRVGAVTIATNMAGRGVDILLGGNPEGIGRARLRKDGIDLTTLSGAQWDDAVTALRSGGDPTTKYPSRPDDPSSTFAEVLTRAWRETQSQRQQVLEKGGLFVLGTERHEARRIDNQLRGRAGRQGDPGESRFFVALQDDLMVRFGGERVKRLMDSLGVADDQEIESGMVSRQIEAAQVKVEGYNFDLRKHLLEYDEVINEQRRVIYQQRTEVLTHAELRTVIWQMVEEEVADLVAAYTSGDHEDWDTQSLALEVHKLLGEPGPEAGGEAADWSPASLRVAAEDWSRWSADEVEDRILELAAQAYDAATTRFGDEVMPRVERELLLRVIDQQWINHLTALDELRTGIGLRAFGQQDPLVTFKREGYQMFQQLLAGIRAEVPRAVFYAHPRAAVAAPRSMAGAVAGRGRLIDRAMAAANASGTTGTVRVGQKLGRNDPCHCGSGKKYKACHWRADQAAGGAAAAGAQPPGGAPASKGGKRRRH